MVFPEYCPTHTDVKHRQTFFWHHLGWHIFKFSIPPSFSPPHHFPSSSHLVSQCFFRWLDNLQTYCDTVWFLTNLTLCWSSKCRQICLKSIYNSQVMHFLEVVLRLMNRCVYWHSNIIELVTLQSRTSPSVQTEVDLHTTKDRWRKSYKKRNVVSVSFNSSLKRDVLQSFFVPRLTEMLCIYS